MAALGGRRLVTETLTSSQTWVAPLSTSRIETLIGKGQDGTSSSIEPGTALAVVVRYNTSGTGTAPASNTWSNLQGAANGIRDQFNAGGNFSAYWAAYDKYADGTESLVAVGPTAYSAVIAGSATLSYTGDWRSSGAVTSSGNAYVLYQYSVTGAPGSNSTGFGFTFFGGSTGTAATPITQTNVTVTPGASYPLVIPSGGSIQITYYR
jgi:hypothetical protein